MCYVLICQSCLTIIVATLSIGRLSLLMKDEFELEISGATQQAVFRPRADIATHPHKQHLAARQAAASSGYLDSSLKSVIDSLQANNDLCYK